MSKGEKSADSNFWLVQAWHHYISGQNVGFEIVKCGKTAPEFMAEAAPPTS